MNAELLMLCGGVFALGVTIYWVRRRELSEKFALGWMLVASFLFICGLFPRTIEFFAEKSHLSYPSAVLFVALGGVYLFALRVSVTLTRLNRRAVLLVQTIALLESRLRDLEGPPKANSFEPAITPNSGGKPA